QMVESTARTISTVDRAPRTVDRGSRVDDGSNSGIVKGTSHSVQRLSDGVPPWLMLVDCANTHSNAAEHAAASAIDAVGRGRPTSVTASAGTSSGNQINKPRLGSIRNAASSRASGACGDVHPKSGDGTPRRRS